PAGRTYTCRWQIPPFSCETSASRGSFGANEKIYMMRQNLIALIAACLLNFSPICRAAYAAAEPEVVDGVAAVVNGDVVTYSQVRGLVAPREKLLRAQFNGEELTSKAQIKLRLIMIPSHASDGNAAAQKAMADEILGKLVNGAEFERMAQLYSEDSTREHGGDWGWVERKTLAAPLEKAAFSLEPGKISNIIEFGGNYYILKVEDKHGGDTKSLADARADIEKKLIQQEAQNLQERWLTSLRSKAYIKTF